jgi:hypothetical protein
VVVIVIVASATVVVMAPAAEVGEATGGDLGGSSLLGIHVSHTDPVGKDRTYCSDQ